MLTNGGPPTLAPTLTNGGPPTENADTKRNSVKKLSEPESMPVDSYEFGGGQGGQGSQPNKKHYDIGTEDVGRGTSGILQSVEQELFLSPRPSCVW